MFDPKTFDDLRSPRRWPWLLLLAALIAGAVCWHRREKPEAPAIEEEPLPPPAIEERPGLPAAVAASRPVSRVEEMNAGVLLSEGKAFENRGEWVDARRKYLELLLRVPSGEARREAEDRLGRMNVESALTQRPMPEKADYIVQSGDFLGKIARKSGMTEELIQLSNDITNPNRIRKGDRLSILQGTFKIRVSKTRNELTLYFNDAFFKRYSVGTGKQGSTPVGAFKITQRIKDPDWWRPDGKQVKYGDKENILGTRWLALDARSYGIHGTWDESSIGKAESAGCIRMRNKDVEELFVLVPVGTAVEIGE